jgi:hypothetical protein
MNAIAQFNQLGGKTVTRKSLISLRELAYLEGSEEIIHRIDTVLNLDPEATDFDLVLETPAMQISLGAAQHSGLYREALDECGRLQKGFKFENGFVVRVANGEVDKRKFKKATVPAVEKPAITTKKATSYGKKRPFTKSEKIASIDEKPTRTAKKASDYGKKRDFSSKKVKYPFSKDDIPFETAKKAYDGTSFSSEKIAVAHQNEYYSHLVEVYDTNIDKAKKLDKLDEFNSKFDRYKSGYLKRYLAYLYSRSGLMSTMITGASNFPVRRMEKKNISVNNKLNELVDYQKYSEFFKPESNIIKTGSDTALDQLKEKLRKEEEAHAMTLTFNKIMRKKVSNEQKEKELLAAGFKQKTLDEARKSGFFELGSYVSSNRSARMRELKRRIKVEELLSKKAEAAAENPTEITFDGGTIENDFSDNRIKIFFDSIPSAEIRSFLKKGGQAFKWSPTNKAWQRQLNTYYSGNRKDLYNFLGVTEPEPTKKKVVEPENNAKSTVPMEAKNNAKSANIQVLNLSEITLDPKRFQNRSELNETIVNNIVKNFNETELDPLIVWKEKTKTFLLAGHHRYEGLTRLKKKTASVKYFKGTEAEAIEFAKVKSNSNRSLETPIERAKIYRGMASTSTKKAIEEKAKEIEGKNATYILNLSALNANGLVIDSLLKLAAGDKQNAALIEKIADWIGDVKRTYTNLTNAHEKEMFDFLMNKEDSKRITTKAEFRQKIYAIVGTLDFDNSQPLNLKRFKYQTEGEKVYDNEFNELKTKVAEKVEQKADLIDRLSNVRRPDFISADDEANKIAALKLAEMNAEISRLQAKLIELSKSKSAYVGAGQNQAALFGAMPINYVPIVEQARQTNEVAERMPVAKTSNKLMSMQFDSLEMDEGWQNLMQDPARNMKIAIWGKPKNGKTSGALQLASYLTKFGKVIYNFVDQGFNKSTQDLWIDSGLANNPNAEPSDITSSKDLEAELKKGKYTFCFIDMISDWIRTEKMKPEEFKERFMRQFPEVSFILIFEVTKGGDFKGDQGWTHLVDAIMTVENFLIENRGRYGMGEKIVWEEGFKKFAPKRYAEFMENSAPGETEEENIFSEEIEKI